MAKIVVVNPVFGHTGGPQEALWYWEPYGDQIHDFLRSRGIDHAYLKAQDATGEKVRAAVEPGSKLAICGHGSYDTLTAYRLDPVYWVDMTARGIQVPAGAEIFALSCETAKQLGPWMVQNGLAGYLGWEEDFIFYVIIGVRKDPDAYDYHFLKPIEEAMEKWLAGEWTLEDAYRYIYVDYQAKAGSPRYPPDVRQAFLWDMTYMRIIRPLPPPPKGKITYTVKVVLPDGSERIIAQGEAPWPQDLYVVQGTMPSAGPEGDGKLGVRVKLTKDAEEKEGEAWVAVKLAMPPPPPPLKVEILEPTEGSTLFYGKPVTVKFRVAETE